MFYKNGSNLIAIEVKSGRLKESLRGFDIFCKQYNPKRKLSIGLGGISIEEFLLTPPDEWYN
ncbi:MAG: hypothetical protein QHH13_05385 [Melioribacter sp.]|uniref:hypothetical protein n=1 Tax=Rosettibacter primus TaxID=3111523 RepID=UPI00247DEFF1|nr:hypothetical protein [Melioribacter sp.]